MIPHKQKNGHIGITRMNTAQSLACVLGKLLNKKSAKIHHKNSFRISFWTIFMFWFIMSFKFQFENATLSRILAIFLYINLPRRSCYASRPTKNLIRQKIKWTSWRYEDYKGVGRKRATSTNRTHSKTCENQVIPHIQSNQKIRTTQTGITHVDTGQSSKSVAAMPHGRLKASNKTKIQGTSWRLEDYKHADRTRTTSTNRNHSKTCETYMIPHKPNTADIQESNMCTKNQRVAAMTNFQGTIASAKQSIDSKPKSTPRWCLRASPDFRTQILFFPQILWSRL